MRKFLVKTILFFFGFVIIDIAYGKACEYLQHHAHGGWTMQENYVVDSVRADVLIFGSSRGRMQYDAKMIGDSLGMTCFNCSHDGMGIIFEYGRMKLIQQRYMPKMIIYDVLPILDELSRDDNMIFANELRSYYGRNKDVDSIFWTLDPTERYKMLSNTYRYHGKLTQLVMDYRNHSGFPKYGFAAAPADNIICGSDLNQKEPTGQKEDSVKLYYLEKFIREYKDKTKLIFVVSPRYNFKTSHTVDPLRRLCKKYGVTLLDHYADPDFVFHKSWFQDGNHMNITGAEEWTKVLIKEIKRL